MFLSSPLPDRSGAAFVDFIDENGGGPRSPASKAHDWKIREMRRAIRADRAAGGRTRARTNQSGAAPTDLINDACKPPQEGQTCDRAVHRDPGHLKADRSRAGFIAHSKRRRSRQDRQERTHFWRAAPAPRQGPPQIRWVAAVSGLREKPRGCPPSARPAPGDATQGQRRIHCASLLSASPG
jgi:hypothetical protein